MTHTHWEIAFLVFSSGAVLVTSYLFGLDLKDFRTVKRCGTNGPILFLVTDKIRHQAFMVLVSIGMAILAAVGIQNTTPNHLGTQGHHLLHGGVVCSMAILVDALFVYRRRRKLAEFVAAQIPGGRRIDDPPKPC